MATDAILIGSDALGSGDEKLGRILLGSFLRLLGDRETLPEYIILWNAGVKTAAMGSEALEHLIKLEERGVKIISCRTCVEYFGLENEMAAGEVDGMARIQEILVNSTVLTV